MSLIKSVATVGGWTSVSRVLGFVRDILIARFLGASMAADAFFVALRFPNLFRSFFAEGTLNVAFVPLFSGDYHTKGKEVALAFAKQACSVLFYVLLLFTFIVEIAMPVVVFILAPGFDTIPGKLALTADLTRITFPFLLCISVVSLLSGMLNAVGRFWVAAFVPIILNLSMIGALFIGAAFFEGAYVPAYALSIGVCVAGVLEVLFLCWALKRAQLGFAGLESPLILFRLPKEVKELMRKMIPGIFGAGVYQINLFLDTFFVSFVGAGAISWLNYANHVFQLPIGIIGTAIGTALLPVLSKHIKLGEIKEANHQLNRGLELSIAMALASMIGLLFLSLPVIRILFERGLFTPSDSYHTARALWVFGLGLPAYMMTKTLSPFFYARGDTATPVKIAVVGVIINAILAVSLMPFLKYVGIALATTIAVWINALQYVIILKRRGDFSLDATFLFRAKGIGISALLMVGALAMCRLWIPLEGQGLMAFMALMLVMGIGGGIFLGGLICTRVIDKHSLKLLLKKGAK